MSAAYTRVFMVYVFSKAKLQMIFEQVQSK